VLMGHSQGGSMLTRLIKDEIDDRPEVRARVVSALVIGSDLEVPEGKDVGGDFQNIPLCRTAGQVGCAIGYSTFRSTAPPPPDSYFGRPSADSTGRQVACVNPAALAGGEATVHPYFPTPMRPGAMPDLAPVTTPYLTFPGMLSAECVLENGFSYLRVTVHADPSDPRPDDIAGDLTPVWGLHLVDVHLALGDLIEVVRAQAAAWPTS